MSYFNNGYYSPNNYTQPQYNNASTNYSNPPTSYSNLNNSARYGITYATEEEVKAYILPPNAQLLALDREKSVFYIKSSDNLGRSMTEIFKYDKVIDEQNQPKMPDNYVTKDDLSNLITRAEFESFMAQCKDIEKLLKVNKSASPRSSQELPKETGGN